MGTRFSVIYDRFLGKVTDDMYMELTPQDTLRDLQNLLIEAIPGFEFPRKSLDYFIKTEEVLKEEITEDDYVIENNIIDKSSFVEDLSSEEINILAILMMIGWIQRQVTSIENTRMKYSGSDFKMTSQANHLSKLLTLQSNTEKQSLHMQRLYKRRKNEDGRVQSNWGVLRFGIDGEY